MIDPTKILATTTIKKMVSTVIIRGIVTRGGLSSQIDLTLRIKVLSRCRIASAERNCQKDLQ